MPTVNNEEKIIVTIDADLEDITERYITSLKSELDSILTYHTEAEYEKIRIAGHGMKGTGGGYGMPLISKIGAAIESAAEEREDAVITQSIVTAQQFLHRVTLAIKG